MSNPNDYVRTFNAIAEREYGPNPVPEIWADRNLQIEMEELQGEMYLSGIDLYLHIAELK